MNIFIINPKAGNKKGVELIPSLMNLDDTLIHVTKNKGEAISFLQEITKKYPNSIVYSVGGDGTLNEVVNGIYGSNSKLHVVPFGSGNDYYKIIKDVSTKKVSIGDVNGKKFINIASLGVDAKIVDVVNKDKIQFLKYQRNILKSLLTYEKEEVLLDNNRYLINILAICIGKYYGNGVPINPNYCLDKENFNVIVANNMTRLEEIICFLKIFKGTHFLDKKVNTFRTSNLEIKSLVPILCEVDGEVFKDDYFNFKVINEGITITNEIPNKVKKIIYK